MGYFLWLKDSITDTNTTECLYKKPLTVAIQYYSIIESYQFLHFLDLTSNLSELKTIFT